MKEGTRMKKCGGTGDSQMKFTALRKGRIQSMFRDGVDTGRPSACGEGDMW